jgi:sRNA-binding carbon storage regulator CsrA
MLTLTRRVGESIYLGDDTCLTVYDRLRYHVLIGVLAPERMAVACNAHAVRPATLPGGERFFLLTLLSGDEFTVGGARVLVRFRPTFLSAQSMQRRQMKVSVDAPGSIPVLREEVYLDRLAASGRRLPPAPFSTWLHRANRAVSARMAA